MNKNIFFDGSMDQECLAIGEAVNSLPGCKIICSCCGHDKEPFEIIFTCNNTSSLNIILLAVKLVDNPRYKKHEWSCNVWASMTDAKIIGIPFAIRPAPEYSLISSSIGPGIYVQANAIGQAIITLAKKSTRELFQLNCTLKNGIDRL